MEANLELPNNVVRDMGRAVEFERSDRPEHAGPHLLLWTDAVNGAAGDLLNGW